MYYSKFIVGSTFAKQNEFGSYDYYMVISKHDGKITMSRYNSENQYANSFMCRDLYILPPLYKQYKIGHTFNKEISKYVEIPKLTFKNTTTKMIDDFMLKYRKEMIQND